MVKLKREKKKPSRNRGKTIVWQSLLQNAVELHQQGKIQDAIDHYHKVLKENPDQVDAWHLLGVAEQQQGELSTSLQCIQKAIHLKPDEAMFYINLANTQYFLKDFQSAAKNYSHGHIQDPKIPLPWIQLADCFHKIGSYPEAMKIYEKILTEDPNHTAALFQLGHLYQALGHSEKAYQCHQKINQKNPHADLEYNLGVLAFEQGHLIQAKEHLQHALHLNPEHSAALSRYYFTCRNLCEWDSLETLESRLDQQLQHSTLTPPGCESPFINVARCMDPTINQRVARAWSRWIREQVGPPLPPRFSSKPRSEQRKIRLGYLSNDFQNHATAHLISGLFEKHNSDRFEVSIFSYGGVDHSPYRKRIQTACPRFIDVTLDSPLIAAQKIQAAEIDILIDLKGYSRGSRLEICALKPAPVQISYLGFPGTLGSDFTDYIIADPLVLPEWHASFYDEKIIYLPDCYQVNDDRQSMAPDIPSRSQLGLPETGFVFASFNQGYKLDPTMFEVWLQLMQATPGSVLWLYQDHEAAVANLRQYAKNKGVDPKRLVFASTSAKDQHLSRLQVADLMLDTQTYTGHTTTSDALWAGLPVVTCEGKHFASRVCSSLLKSMDLPQLIARDLKEYRSIAERLAHHPEALKDLKQKILLNRKDKPLFNTQKFTDEFESVLKRVFNEIPK